MKTSIAFAALLLATLPAQARNHHRHHWHHHHRHHHFARPIEPHARTAAAHHPPMSPAAAADLLATPIFSDLGRTLEHLVEQTISNIVGMNDAFVAKLRAAFAADPAPCHIGSGFRSYAEQARLYREKPGLAAPPGHSNHEKGLAADLSCKGDGLAWLHAHAHEYGLHFPMSHEAWHIEPAGLTKVARRHHDHRTRYAAHHHRTHYARAG
jgi:hypothetical protein